MVAEIKKSSKFISYTIDYPIKAGKVPEEIKTIRVVGDFGSWSGWLDMKKSSDGEKYTADVSVRPGTTITYEFLINGNIWTSDDSDGSNAVSDQDGHVKIVKKVLDTDDSIKSDSSSSKSETSSIKSKSSSSSSESSDAEQKKEVSDKKTTTPKTTTADTTTKTTTTTKKTKKEKKEKKSFFKRLFSCFA